MINIPHEDNFVLGKQRVNKGAIGCKQLGGWLIRRYIYNYNRPVLMHRRDSSIRV